MTHDVYITYPSTRNSSTQEPDDVLALDAGTVEALGPSDQPGFRKALLAAREREGEAERELEAGHAVLLGEEAQAVDDVVEQLQQRQHEIPGHQSWLHSTISST